MFSSPFSSYIIINAHPTDIIIVRVVINHPFHRPNYLSMNIILNFTTLSKPAIGQDPKLFQPSLHKNLFVRFILILCFYPCFCVLKLRFPRRFTYRIMDIVARLLRLFIINASNRFACRNKSALTGSLGFAVKCPFLQKWRSWLGAPQLSLYVCVVLSTCSD